MLYVYSKIPIQYSCIYRNPMFVAIFPLFAAKPEYKQCIIYLIFQNSSVHLASPWSIFTFPLYQKLSPLEPQCFACDIAYWTCTEVTPLVSSLLPWFMTLSLVCFLVQVKKIVVLVCVYEQQSLSDQQFSDQHFSTAVRVLHLVPISQH
jgi:hypothetical protein